MPRLSACYQLSDRIYIEISSLGVWCGACVGTCMPARTLGVHRLEIAGCHQLLRAQEHTYG